MPMRNQVHRFLLFCTDKKHLLFLFSLLHGPTIFGIEKFIMRDHFPEYTPKSFFLNDKPSPSRTVDDN